MLSTTLNTSALHEGGLQIAFLKQSVVMANLPMMTTKYDRFRMSECRRLTLL